MEEAELLAPVSTTLRCKEFNEDISDFFVRLTRMLHLSPDTNRNDIHRVLIYNLINSQENRPKQGFYSVVIPYPIKGEQGLYTARLNMTIFNPSCTMAYCWEKENFCFSTVERDLVTTVELRLVDVKRVGGVEAARDGSGPKAWVIESDLFKKLRKGFNDVFFPAL